MAIKNEIETEVNEQAQLNEYDAVEVDRDRINDDVEPGDTWKIVTAPNNDDLETRWYYITVVDVDGDDVTCIVDESDEEVTLSLSGLRLHARHFAGAGPVNNDGERLVTDGGKAVPKCGECDADLLDSAELETDRAPVAGARGPNPVTREVPAAECGECGASVGAMHGMTVVEAVWEARGESPFGDDDEQRLVTDGGHRIDTGDEGRWQATLGYVAGSNEVLR